MKNEVVNTQNHEIAKYLAGQLLKVVLITVFFLSFPVSLYIRGYADFTQMPTLALLSNHNYTVGLGTGVAGCFFFLISMIDFIADCLKLFFAKDKTAQLKSLRTTNEEKEQEQKEEIPEQPISIIVALFLFLVTLFLLFILIFGIIKYYHSLNIETMNYGLFFGSALGCLFIIVTLLLSEKINKDLNKILIVFAFILGVLTSISAIDGTKKIAQKQSKSVKQRMFNYVELKNKSIHIENQYVKDIIDEVIKQVHLQVDEKIVIEIFVPKDFNSPNRKNEYDETMNLLKDSGFLKVEYYYTDRDCLHGNSGCNNEYSAIRIWD